MGKNLGDDLREGKATLPLIIAMQRGKSSEQQLIRQAIEGGQTGQLPEIIAIVRQTGALQATRDAAAAEAQRAIVALRVLERNRYSEALLQLASQLLERRS
jgi:octaprenyl-diphosphate synthase